MNSFGGSSRWKVSTGRFLLEVFGVPEIFLDSSNSNSGEFVAECQTQQHCAFSLVMANTRPAVRTVKRPD